MPLSDSDYMALAIAQGRLARRISPPNPWVGCVLVRDGEIVGQGHTQPPGSNHAEIEAIEAAGDRARGATAYVTLEPCSHYGRTGPCADAVIAAGISRVIIGVLDPDANVAGRGLEKLRAAGIEATVSPDTDTIARELAPYLHQRRTRRPYVVAKTALSIDGRTAASDGSSQWITGPAARADVHELRADSQAVLVGSGTALFDHPTLTARDTREPVTRQPLRVLLDGSGTVPAEGPLFDQSLAPTLVITASASASRIDEWRAAGAEVEVVARNPEDRGVDLHAALDLLGARGIIQLLVEGGATLDGALLRAGLVDRLVVYVGGLLFGQLGRPMFDGHWAHTIADAQRWKLADLERVGEDVRLDYEPIESARI